MPSFGAPALVDPAAPLQLLHHGHQRLLLQVQLKDGPHPLRLVRVDLKAVGLGIDVVAQDGCAAGPLAFTPRGRDLVPSPLRDDLALELGEGQQHVEYQAAHRRSSIKLLGHAHEGDLPLVETPHHPREVQEAAAEAVDFVDVYCLDKTGVDVG